MGKGSKRRPCNEQKVASNWPWKQPPLNVWVKDANEMDDPDSNSNSGNGSE